MGAGRVFLMVVAVLVLALAAYLTLWPVPFEPRAWQPPGNAMEEPGWPDTVSPPATRFIADEAPKPEAIAQGPDGALYTGVEDGRILRFDPDTGDVSLFADVGGQPLGLKFGPDGHLYVANAVRGLQGVAPDGTARVIVDAVDGVKMKFADDLAIAADGTIWLSDATQRYSMDDLTYSAWEMEHTGRLLRLAPGGTELETVLGDLAFANGVALSANEDFVLVTETTAYRITRLWLRGPRAGEREVFVDGLPGFVDNVTWDPDTRLFWVAIPGARDPGLDRLHASPGLKKAAYRLLSLLGVEAQPAPAGWVLGIDDDGIVRVHLDLMDQDVSDVTSAVAVDGALWLGTVYRNGIVRVPVPSGAAVSRP